MSFSKDVKEELQNQIGQARHCRLAELAVMIRYNGQLQQTSDGEWILGLKSENEALVRKYFTLLKKTFNIDDGLSGPEDNSEKNRALYSVNLSNREQCERVLQAVKIPMYETKDSFKDETMNPLLIKTTCCKRAFLRGTYLCNGSMGDPSKGYHLEFVCNTTEQAQQLRKTIGDFEIESRLVERRGKQVVYIKEAEAIVELLNIMEAHKSLMELENIRILKEIGNHINRGNNCYVANRQKAAEAMVNQKEDILYIQQHGGFAALSDELQQTALMRLDYPDATLQEFGQLLNPPIGKSGVNHRLRKLSEIAEQLRHQGGEKHDSEEDDNSSCRRS